LSSVVNFSILRSKLISFPSLKRFPQYQLPCRYPNTTGLTASEVNFSENCGCEKYFRSDSQVLEQAIGVLQRLARTVHLVRCDNEYFPPNTDLRNEESKMKTARSIWSLVAVAAFAALGAQSASAAIGTIVNSKHDFSATGPSATYKGTSTQVCVYCHAPHNGGGTTLLWNHAASAATYTLYTKTTSSTMDATIGQPGAVSKLCLSCHDGTVAVDSFGGATGNKLATGVANLGTDLSNDHPIGFAYNAALVTADPGLRAVSTAATIGTGNTGTIETKMLFGASGAATVECASCHDVHNSTSGTAVESKLLRQTTAGSALCMTCHIK
jgi:predicted CXXCH cytochrome family protein